MSPVVKSIKIKPRPKPTKLAQLYRFTAWTPIVFLGALLALTYWLDAQIQAQTAGGDAAQHVPDIFIKKFNAVVYSKEGVPQEQLTADYGEHFVDDDSFELKNVTLLLDQPARPRMTVVAQNAVVAGDRKNVVLKNKVVAHRMGCAEAGLPCVEKPMKLATEYLHLATDTRIADTRHTVWLSSPDGEVRADGIVIDDAKHVLTLQSNIRGTFEPRAIPKPVAPKSTATKPTETKPASKNTQKSALKQNALKQDTSQSQDTSPSNKPESTKKSP